MRDEVRAGRRPLHPSSLIPHPSAARPPSRSGFRLSGVKGDDLCGRAGDALAQGRRLDHLNLRAEAERVLARLLLELEAHRNLDPPLCVRLADALDAREAASVRQAGYDLLAYAQRRPVARQLRLELRGGLLPKPREVEAFGAHARLVRQFGAAHARDAVAAHLAPD